MNKVVILLFICDLTLALKDYCDLDTVKLCANIKDGLKAINTGAQEVGSGTDVEEVKETLDAPQQSTFINGNFTLLLMALDKNPLDFVAHNCLNDTANQSSQIADYIDTIATQLQNDIDKMLDVQGNLRSVSRLYNELQSPSSTDSIQRERNKICRNIFTNFEKIDSGATRIANGEDVNKVKAEVNGPQLASDIRNDYVRLVVVSQRILKNKDIEECMAKTSDRAEQQVKQIEGILDKLPDDWDKVNAVFKDFKEIKELQIEHVRCPPKIQILVILSQYFNVLLPTGAAYFPSYTPTSCV